MLCKFCANVHNNSKRQTLFSLVFFKKKILLFRDLIKTTIYYLIASQQKEPQLLKTKTTEALNLLVQPVLMEYL